MSTNDILRVKDLNVSYGESKVLFDISLTIRANDIRCCVGRNGAGKTTLLKTIAGFLKPVKGSVFFKGKNIVGSPPYEIAKMGLRYIPQDKKVFSDLTVSENLELASYATKDYNWRRVLEFFPKLKDLLPRKGAFLSGGERQMLMIGRALLGKPDVLLLDEPTEGLAPSIVEHLARIFTEMRKDLSLVVVEQNLHLVSKISNNVYAIKEGEIVSETSDQEGIRNIVFEKYL
jgi:ABC-type branched-subunit amino acid transport system ATPase component